MTQPILQVIFENIVEGDQNAVTENVKKAIATGLDPTEILNDGMVAAMAKVGQLFEDGEFYVPEMLISARAMQAGMAVLKPSLVQANFQPVGKVVTGTVKGDLHDIGKRLVCMMLEGASFEVIDLGTDVPAERFIEAVRSSGAKMIALSALLTTTMPNMRSTIDALKVAGIRDQVKVIVGGAPLTEQYAREIGADGFAPDASRAVALAKSLVA